jgi:hypothetical protein
MTTRNKLTLSLLVLLALLLSACQANWSIALTENGASLDNAITRDEVDYYIETLGEDNDTVLLDQFLYDAGYRLIDQIVVSSEDAAPLTYTWEEVAEYTFISDKGELIIEGVTIPADSIDIQPSERLSDIELSIMDISPTVLNALGLPALPDAEGQMQFDFEADQAVIILTDGTQYDKLNAMAAAGDLPFFQSQDKIHCGLTVYPSVTTSSSAALFTSTPPSVNQVYGHGFRSTEQTTLFDILTDNEKMAIAIEGASMPFNLRNAEVILSGDRDSNGYSDDNVYLNAVEVIQNNLPHLLYIHFHEIDDMGHEYGENSPEYEAALIRVDQYITDIVDLLPSDTLIVILADHGMHTTSDGGNHGTLAVTDMLIPVTFIQK